MKHDLTHFFVVLGLAALTAVVAVFLPTAAIAILLVGLLVWVISHHLALGLYGLLFLYPFLGWQLNFGTLDATRGIPLLGNINAPLADFWALLLGAALITHVVRAYLNNKTVSLKVPGILLFGLFVGSALLSLFNARVGEVGDGLQYLIRNIIFIYAAYMVLPSSILSTKKQIMKGITALHVAGFVAVLWGVVSLFVVEPFWGVWRRVTPFAIGGWAPLGTFHNDLAEVLVILIPLAIYWYFEQRSDRARKLTFLYASVLIVVTLLTFSRTAWIVLLVQLGVFLAVGASRQWRAIARSAAPFVLVLLIPIAVYMVVFSSSSYVASSTSARMDLTRIATLAFAEHPIIGNGLGSYIRLVSEATAFRIEYGPPFDAHGVIQKISAEQGVVGLITALALVGWMLWMIYEAYRTGDKRHKALLLTLLIVAVSAAVYQVFNTQYYTAKMWMPMGFAFAASQVFKSKNKIANSKNT